MIVVSETYCHVQGNGSAFRRIKTISVLLGRAERSDGLRYQNSIRILLLRINPATIRAGQALFECYEVRFVILPPKTDTRHPVIRFAYKSIQWNKYTHEMKFRRGKTFTDKQQKMYNAIKFRYVYQYSHRSIKNCYFLRLTVNFRFRSTSRIVYVMAIVLCDNNIFLLNTAHCEMWSIMRTSGDVTWYICKTITVSSFETNFTFLMELEVSGEWTSHGNGIFRWKYSLYFWFRTPNLHKLSSLCVLLLNNLPKSRSYFQPIPDINCDEEQAAGKSFLK